MTSPRPRQLFFEFDDSPQGGKGKNRADASAREPHLLHTSENNGRTESALPAAEGVTPLLEEASSLMNLEMALEKVARNKGAAGVDGQSVDEVSAHADDLLPMIRDALRSGTFQPGDIRRVWIPKPGGGQRGLGIPNVVDRVVQQAVLQILEPIWDPTFHSSSHGFRPGRGAHTAIAEASRYVTEGRRYTVDIDLSKFFDRVNHQRLLDRLGQRVKDRGIWRLVRLMLKAKVVLPDGTRVSSEEGTPQGGPLSPLLSNIVLDELDQELARRGHRFVRYADDCNIYVRSERSGHRVMASIRRFIEGRLRLKVNEEKSAVDLAQRRHFLGFRVGGTRKGRAVTQLSKRTLERFDTRLRELTPRNLGRSLDSCLVQLNRYLRGWMAYFQPCTREIVRTLRYLDGHMRRRIRAIIVCHKKRARHLFRDLVKRGVSRATAARTAFSRKGPWKQSNMAGMTRAYSNPWFAERLESLEQLWRAHMRKTKPTPRPKPPEVQGEWIQGALF